MNRSDRLWLKRTLIVGLALLITINLIVYFTLRSSNDAIATMIPETVEPSEPVDYSTKIVHPKRLGLLLKGKPLRLQRPQFNL